MTDALWVGGPPGATLANLRRKLAGDGIAVVDVQREFRALPARARLVLINVDMIGHGDFDKVRTLAEDRRVPWVPAHNSYTLTRRALVTAGFLPVDVNAHNNEETNVPDEERKPTSQEVEAFLRQVPKELLPQARTTIASRLREDDVVGAASHISALDDDGLVEFVAFLDDTQRRRLRDVLGG